MPTELKNESFLLIWNQIHKLFIQNELSEQEFVGFFLFLWSIHLKPKTWRGPRKNFNYSSEHSSSNLKIKDAVQILQTFGNENIKPFIELLKTDQPEKKWVHWCAENFLQTTPHATISAFKEWLIHPQQLKLMNFIPSPEQVLTLQAQGTRCLSLVYNPDNHLQIIANGKNSFEFLTHDLIHADRFFRDQESARSQRFFCQNILIIYKFSQIQQALAHSEDFRNRFEYLTSDMNSHFIHLLKTFRALIESSQAQSPQNSNRLTWTWVQTQWPWTEPIKISFLNLNTSLESSNDHELIYKTALKHINSTLSFNPQ